MEWRDIKGFSGYMVSDEGQVYSMKSKRLLTISDHGDGYKTVVLQKDGKSKHPFVHRLVYETFIGSIPVCKRRRLSAEQLGDGDRLRPADGKRA